ncbi:hypothetical protein Halar_1637 [halophilic archaeon DL31]|jgi:uncharacterized protein with PIN domain|nr:hypothetical protein Halar_1637 [halophilic archaeon DL31]
METVIFGALSVGFMALCPSCEREVRKLERAFIDADWGEPVVWQCPHCETILGTTDTATHG